MNTVETSGRAQPGSPEGGDVSLVRLLNPDYVVLKLESTNKIDVLRELSSLLVAGQPREVQEAVVAALIQREEVGSTVVIRNRREY